MAGFSYTPQAQQHPQQPDNNAEKHPSEVVDYGEMSEKGTMKTAFVSSVSPQLDGDNLRAVQIAMPRSSFDMERNYRQSGEVDRTVLRNYSTAPDPDKEDPWTFNRWMIFVAMGFLWTGSQIPMYLFGGIIPIVESEIGGADRSIWLLCAYLIPLASITPFVGPLADLIGRRELSMVAVAFMVIGCIIDATSHSMNVFIGGMVFLGIGAGILELTAIAVVGESAPTKKRGLYIGCIILTIIPYCPSVMYAELISHYASWRWISLWIGCWNLVGGVLTFFFYYPPPRWNAEGLTRAQLAKRIDVVGGITSTAGLTLLIMALSWGGNQYEWTNPHVLVTICLAGFFIIFFVIWEIWIAKYPMFPRRLGACQKTLSIIMVITFVSGANFFAVLVFWPNQWYVTYADITDPVSIGLGSLPVGFCIIGGSIVFSIMLSVLKGKIKLMMIISTAIMVGGNGALAAARLDNLPVVYAAVCIACLGVGAVVVPCQIISTIVCPDDLIGTIAALTISVRFVGGSIGYAAYYSVLRKNFTKYAIEYIVPKIATMGVTDYDEYMAIVIAISQSLASKLNTFPHIDTPEKVQTLIEAGQLAFSKAYPSVYLVSIAFGGVAFIASVFLPDVDMLMDNHIAVNYA